MTFKSVASKGMHYLRIGLASLAMFQFTIGAPFADAAPKPQKARDYADRYPHQARHRDHRRKPQLRSRLRHLRTEKWRDRQQPAFGRHHQAGRQQERNSRSEFRQGSTTGGYRYRHLPARSAEAAISQQRTACATGRRSQRCGRLFFRQQPLRHHPGDFSRRVRPAFGKRIADRSYYQDLVSGGTGLTKYTPDTRITNVDALPAGPFQLTNGSTFQLQRLCGKPGASLLSDVAAGKLRRGACQPEQSLRLQRQAVLLG